MKVLVFEDNLIWSARLAKSIKSLGHDCLVLAKLPVELPAAEAAILNLGSTQFDLPNLIPSLKAQETFVVAHAGHKEKPLLEFGNDSGCDLVVSNSTLTFKLDQVLSQASARSKAEIEDEDDINSRDNE